MFWGKYGCLERELVSFCSMESEVTMAVLKTRSFYRLPALCVHGTVLGAGSLDEVRGEVEGQ